VIQLRAPHRALYRYVPAEVGPLVLNGSILVSTFARCRQAENLQAQDIGEGRRTIGSLPGVTYPTSREAAFLIAGDPNASIRVGPGGIRLEGSNAVRRTERVPDAFVLCLSALANDSQIKARFGSACIGIVNLDAFVELVDNELRKQVTPIVLSDCVIDSVEYSSRDITYRDFPTKGVAFIKPLGTPAYFEVEHEVRAVWLPEGNAPIDRRILEIPAVRPFLQQV
jgi:hypothetical protein